MPIAFRPAFWTIRQAWGGGEETLLERFEKPIAPDGETSDQFLARMNGPIRIAGGVEYLLAVITLIFIRLRSVKSNAEAGGPGGGRRIPNNTRNTQPVGFSPQTQTANYQYGTQPHAYPPSQGYQSNR